MSDEQVKTKAHSEEYFGETRDFWWNEDFLSLMAERLELGSVRTVLDVGCGIGHWGQLWARILNQRTQLQGIDFESTSIEKANQRAQKQGIADRFQYQVGDALSLPFADESFDMVTCQTLLIHLKDPRICLREMLRVLKPNGILLAAEPNNFANRSIFDHRIKTSSVEELMEKLKFGFLIERGKSNLGLGFNSEGDLIPGYLAQLGARQIKVYLSDKCTPFFPPYESPAEQAYIKQMEAWLARGFGGWDREEMKRYYLAGGGEESQFMPQWQKQLDDTRCILEAIRSGTYHTSGGCIQYLISARK